MRVQNQGAASAAPHQQQQPVGRSLPRRPEIGGDLAGVTLVIVVAVILAGLWWIATP